MQGSARDVAAFILAGGKSSRMGVDKAFLEFEGRTLLARALEVTWSITPDVRIVGNSDQLASFAPVVEDLFPGCGPLGGIHAGLRASSADLNLVLAVDMPFVTTEFLRFVIAKAQTSPAIVIVPLAGGGWQPLCAIYRREFATVAEQALRARRYKIDPLFELVKTQAIDEQELLQAGFSADVFRNLNTPADLDLAENRIKAQPG